jgi:hypothetical protein
MAKRYLGMLQSFVGSISHVRSRTPTALRTRARPPRPRPLRARRHQSRSAGARPLGETAKRRAEKAERAETSNRWEMEPFPTMARSGGNRRKLAETPCRNSARETVSSFAVSATGCTPSRDWHIASGNCGNSLQILCQASPLRLSASAANGDTSRVYLMRIQRFRTSLQPCRDRRIRRAPACPAGNSASPSTSRW